VGETLGLDKEKVCSAREKRYHHSGLLQNRWPCGRRRFSCLLCVECGIGWMWKWKLPENYARKNLKWNGWWWVNFLGPFTPKSITRKFPKKCIFGLGGDEIMNIFIPVYTPSAGTTLTKLQLYKFPSLPFSFFYPQPTVVGPYKTQEEWKSNTSGFWCWLCVSLSWVLFPAPITWEMVHVWLDSSISYLYLVQWTLENDIKHPRKNLSGFVSVLQPSNNWFSFGLMRAISGFTSTQMQ